MPRTRLIPLFISWVFLIQCCLPLVAQAQTEFVEIIVRLREDAAEELEKSLFDGRDKQSSLDSLFDSVTHIHPVFGNAAGVGKKEATPIPAFVLRVDASSEKAVMRRWAAHPGVAYLQPNHQYRLDGVSLPVEGEEPLLDSLAHLRVIRALEAWETTTGNSDVRVGLIDTGLFFEHPDFEGQVWINAGEDLDGDGRATDADFNGIDDDSNGYVDDLQGYDFVDRATSVELGDYFGRDSDPSEDNLLQGGRGHGTTVAGVLIAAMNNVGVVGVAPGTRLVPLRAFGADGLGEDDDVAAAIVYAAQQEIEVLNLSFGDVYVSPLMEEAIHYAVNRGTVVVASGGNLGGDDPHYPSDYPDVIGVTWLEAEGTMVAGRAQYGIGIDLGAPGSNIYTTLLPSPLAEDPTSQDQLWGRRSGSSVAAPMVSAAAALLRSVDPTLSPASVRSILTGSALDIGEPGWDHLSGAGRLDVANALTRALPARIEIMSPAHNGGTAASMLDVIGTVLHPLFESYSVSFQPGDKDLLNTWHPIAEPITTQVLNDTLIVWDVAGLQDGTYTLRLAVQLHTGQSMEDRRRIFLDRTPPEIDLHLLDDGLIGSDRGVIVDLSTDDVAAVALKVTLNGDSFLVDSDRIGRSHGLAWADETGRGGEAIVEITATNTAELGTTTRSQLTIPPNQENTALFQEFSTDVPHGYLLPEATDFDRDGLLEIVLNQYQDGWIGDTLAFFEWNGTSFSSTLKLIANVLPRDVGDSDGDGRLELLTQVAAATLLFEQPDARSYPSDVAFIDTTGLANPFADGAAFGSQITDLDGDGMGEILVHNSKQWRVIEFSGNSYAEVARLANPTAANNEHISQNEFSEPEAVEADFDGDGWHDLLVGDTDGDWILYEARGDNEFAVVWTHETPRYNAGARFALGDFDGDSLPEFVTFTQNWTQPRTDDEVEPSIGLYYFWDSSGDDQYALVDSLPIAGYLSRHGAMTAADFDGDERDELVIVHPPDLFVLGFDKGWTVQHHWRQLSLDPRSSLRSIALVADDFDGDGWPELIAAGADERLHRFVVNAGSLVNTPPRWTQTIALDAATVRLEWQVAGADSVTLYRAAVDEPLSPLASVVDSLFLDQTVDERQYALLGWHDGVATPLSELRRVRPHSPALVVESSTPSQGIVEIVFTEPLDAGIQPEQFDLEGIGAPRAILPAQVGRSLTLVFDEELSGDYVLRWWGVRDVEGTPVGQDSISVSFGDSRAGTLFIVRWVWAESNAIRLVFSDPLDPAFAMDPKHYVLKPSGRVGEIEWDASQPEEVLLRIEGRALGATGLVTALEVIDMRSVDGAMLAREGRTVSLSRAAEDLSDAYVFPNPHDAARHAVPLMVAGLPAEATIRIFTAQGMLVRILEETNGDGGAPWDLRDEAGLEVPSGVYLIRVEAPGQVPVLRKAALIR